MPLTTEAELKRRDPSDVPVSWKLVADPENTETGLSDPVKDFGARARLEQIRDRLPAIGDPQLVEFTDATLDALGLLFEELHVDLTVVLAALEARLSETTLTSRMLGKQPRAGYRIWLDTASTDFYYVGEAPLGSASSAAVFTGVRIPLDVAGNFDGPVEESTALFAWDDRAAATWS